MIDVEFKNLASRVAYVLVDLDLMRGEPYFSEEDIAHAVGVVSQEVDAMLFDAGLSRKGFLNRLSRSDLTLSAIFLRGSFALLNPERNKHEA